LSGQREFALDGGRIVARDTGIVSTEISISSGNSWNSTSLSGNAVERDAG
jgi:hypothetical protein